MLASSCHTSQSTDADITSQLASDHVNVASLWRNIPGHVTRALSTWSQRDVPRFEQTLHSSETVSPHAFSGLPRATRDWLNADVQSWVQLVFDASGSRSVTLKFGVVASNQCRKFHVDYLRYRLITTYLGPGTEWVPNEYVNRRILSEPPEDPDQANALIVTSPNSIQRAKTGEVLLMKGANHAHATGLVHRSPPIEHLATRRVVLVVSAHR